MTKIIRKTYSSQILELLEEKGPQSFGNIQKHLGADPGPISYALKKLASRESIKREQTTRKYEITDAGKFVLHNEQLGRLAIDGKSLAYKEHAVEFDVELEFHPFKELGKMPLDIGLIGDTDLDYGRVIAKIRRELFSFFPQMLAREFAEEVGWQRGVKEPDLMDSLQEPYPRTKRLSWIKEAYDYEITLLLHFNPRKIIRSIDWPEALKITRESEKQSIERLKTQLEGMKINRAAILEDRTSVELNSYWLKSDFIIKPRIESTASSEKELIDVMVESIKKNPSGRLLKKHEIRTALIRKLEEEYKIVSKTVFFLEKTVTNNASS